MIQDTSLVTIIIPTYNQASLVHKAIDSALEQNYPYLEVVVADDSSTDNTHKVAQRYADESRFRYFRNDTNIGRVSNYKRALEQYANGDWVVNCDGDDYYTDPSFIREAMELIVKHADRNIVFVQAGQHVRFAHQPRRDYDVLPPITQPVSLLRDGQYFWEYPQVAYFSHLTALFHRETAIAIDFYRYDISSADRESFLRMALHGDVLQIKKVYAAWVQHGSNFSQRLDFETRRRNIAYITGSYTYAHRVQGGSPRLDTWRKVALTKYFKDWVSRVAMQDLPLPTRIGELRRILQLANQNYHEVRYDNDFYKTIISLPYKLIFQ